MKKIKLLCLAAALLLCTSAVPVSSVCTLSRGYVVSINGTSNLHDWKETVETVTGSGNLSQNSDGSFDLTSMTIKMSVRSIKSKEGSVMNNNTYKALKSRSHPYIIIALASPAKCGIGAVALKANLTIAGVTKAIDMTVTATRQGSSSITLEGAETINMTDYGVKPPVALFGTIKTGATVTIHFKTAFQVSK